MREVLFRGMGLTDKQWHYGFFYTVPLNKHYIRNMVVNPHDAVEVFRGSVGEWTGIHAKIGSITGEYVKLFEGDIVQHWHDGRFWEGWVVGLVEWEASQSAFILDYSHIGISVPICGLDLPFTDAVIVGNDFEYGSDLNLFTQ